MVRFMAAASDCWSELTSFSCGVACSSAVSFGAQVFSAGQARSYTSTWTVPANATPGSYSVKLGAFSADWASGYGWNDSAAAVTVGTTALPITAVSRIVYCRWSIMLFVRP